MKKEPHTTLPLHIILQKPPSGVAFGLQKGTGSNYATIQTQLSGVADLHFTLTIEVAAPTGPEFFPRFRGPFAQGKPGEQFIYIDIGTLAGQPEGWSRRLKIPLRGITWDMVRQVQAHAKQVLQTTVPGTGKDGGPNCATVKPFDGWSVSFV